MGTAQAGVDFCSHCTEGYRHPCVTLEEAQGCGNYFPPPSYEISQESAQTMLDTLVMLTDCNISAQALAAVKAAIAKAKK